MASPATVRAGAGLRVLRAAVFTAVCVVLAAAGHTLASGRTVPGWSLVLGWLAVFAVVAPLAGRERTLPGIAALLAVGQIALHAVFSMGQACAALPASVLTAPAGASGTGAGTGGGSLLAVAARLVCGTHGFRLTAETARAVVSRAGLDPSAFGSTPGAAHAIGMSGAAGMTSMPGMPGMSAGSAGGGAGWRAVLTALPVCSLPMLLGHLLAAVVAGLLLRRGEAALWKLVRLSRRVRGTTRLSPAAALRRAHALLSVLAARAPYPLRHGRADGRGIRARHRSVWLRHSVTRRGPPEFALAA
ncbi:hypothetical protein [Actinacidiphila acididurans]|uniref:Integral membrane protein n=1 Tax=Actinacidiphila acididurans TaxID=2784346 RepID=A0ABS2TRR1_9ACTN|nr:hypothetical protein [Actinacidiphila acididurans]MBM9506023.1 hypothetical protein [Actinacidiphila acididurans]